MAKIKDRNTLIRESNERFSKCTNSEDRFRETWTLMDRLFELDCSRFRCDTSPGASSVDSLQCSEK